MSEAERTPSTEQDVTKEKPMPPVHISSAPPLAVSLVAGAAAGALAKTVIAPLDRAKINFQTSNAKYSARAAAAWLTAAVRREGLSALWRGNSATMARIVPYAAVQFAAHEQWKRLLGVDNPQRAKENKLRHLVAGALAGVTSQSATYPLDLARARMALASRLVTLRDVFSALWRVEGGKAMYRGYWATVLGVVPYAGVSFFTFDNLKRLYTDLEGAPPHGVTLMALGGAAGALGQTASYPLDIVRRRMQTSVLQTDGTYICGTITDTLRIIYNTEGWRGFYKGLSMNWVKGPVATGVSFATYDSIKTTLTVAVTLHRS